MYIDILRCGLNRWTNNWGDPVLLGSAITALFALAAALSLWLALKTTGRERWFWVFVALAAALFGANVHLDLHVLTNALGRCAAQAQGWYDQRETVRGVFLVSVLITTGGLAAAVLWLFHREMLANPVIPVGIGLMSMVQALKGVGWRGLDHINHIHFGPLKALDALDVACAALVIVGAVLALRRRLGANVAGFPDQRRRLP